MRIFFVAILSVSISLSVFGQSLTTVLSNDTVKKEINRFVTARMNGANVAGISIGIVDSLTTKQFLGYGYMDAQHKIAVNEKTIFCYGSISKLFTSLAIMQLHERGKLSIDRPIVEYIPEFHPLGADSLLHKITIASLLCHESGLPSDDLALFFNNADFVADSVITFFNTHYIINPPYTIHAYSNIGFCLLGAVIERVSGERFSDYITRHITKPLQMNNSSFVLESWMKPLLSKQYLYGKKEFVEPGVGLVPAGGFYSNAEDMMKFAQMILKRGRVGDSSIIHDSTFARMTALQNGHIHRDYDMTVGLTWFLTLDGTWFKAGGSISHGGNTVTFHSGLTILPYQNLAIVLSSNSSGGMRIIPDIERKILEKILDKKGINKQFDSLRVSKPLTKQYIDKSNYQRFAGMYAVGNRIVALKSRKNKFLLNFPPFNMQLTPLPDSSFAAKLRLLGFIKISIKQVSKISFDIVEGDTVLVVNSWDRNFFLARKEQPASDSLLQLWKQYEGEYECENAQFKNIAVTCKHQRITFHAQIFNTKIVVDALPQSATQAKVVGKGRGTGDIIMIKKRGDDFVIDVNGVIIKKKIAKK